MKKIICLLLLFLGTHLQAQPTGVAAASSSDAGTSNSWKYWTLAGGGLAVVAVGVLLVALNDGASSTSH